MVDVKRRERDLHSTRVRITYSPPPELAQHEGAVVVSEGVLDGASEAGVESRWDVVCVLEGSREEGNLGVRLIPIISITKWERISQ